MKPVKCFDKTKNKVVYAYHIESCGAAHNKSFTLCIGCIGCDLIIIKYKTKYYIHTTKQRKLPFPT